MGTPHHKPYEKRAERKPYDPDHSYWDSKAFKAYKVMVLQIVKTHAPITMRAIKAELGECQIDAWTADAIDHLLGRSIEATSSALRPQYKILVPVAEYVSVIDGRKENEYKAHLRAINRVFPTEAVSKNYFR